MPDALSPSRRTTPTLPSPVGVLRRAGRRVDRHRRTLAGLLVGAAVLCAGGALLPARDDGVPVLVAARDLPAGAPLVGATAVRSVPAQVVPAGALDAATGPDEGAVLAAPVRAGELLTDARVLGPGLLTGDDDGQVAAPVGVADLPPGLVRAGDVVDVLAAQASDLLDGSGTTAAAAASTAAAGARVLAVLPVDGAPGTGTGQTVLVLAVPAATAARLAGSAATGRLTVALRPHRG